MKRVAYLNSRQGSGPEALTGGSAARVENLYLYDLETDAAGTLANWRALLIPANADQRFLMTLRPQLEQWLLAGGTMVINGHIAYPFLRWLQPFEVQTCPGLAGLQVARGERHPVFDGVDAEHLTYRRGVAGFYARGANPPPPDARVLNTLGPDSQPIDWLLSLPGGGRLLVHSGNDLWMYANGQDSAARIVPQLLAWLAMGAN